MCRPTLSVFTHVKIETIYQMSTMWGTHGGFNFVRHEEVPWIYLSN